MGMEDTEDAVVVMFEHRSLDNWLCDDETNAPESQPNVFIQRRDLRSVALNVHTNTDEIALKQARV